jgi:hypothetical protein
MANPFTFRATEYVKSDEAFLTLIAPDPVSVFLQPYADADGLFVRLVSVQGQPGSGKTTLARLFEFSTLATLQRGRNNESYSPLILPLQKCRALDSEGIRILACRLPLESEYRELWQLPYDERVRMELLQRLIQARAVLSWFSQLRRANVPPSAVSFQVRENSNASLEFIGGKIGDGVSDRAREVESAIYRIIGALVPPSEEQIEAAIVSPYRPFDVIESVSLSNNVAIEIGSSESLIPLVILDDAHFLHPRQLELLNQWLVRRELKVARWVLSRLDVLQPVELFATFSEIEPDINLPGITAGREITQINLQSTQYRQEGRKRFRSMARQMANRYLSQMPVFKQSNITTLEELIPAKQESISEANLEKLQKSLDSAVRRNRVSKTRLDGFDADAVAFLGERGDLSHDLKSAIIRILVHRYSTRTPQTLLFPEDEADPEPNQPIKVDLKVLDAAKIHLFHEFGRPYYYGMDSLSDAASENAETFLRLAAHIVQASENLLIKQKNGVISAKDQHGLLIQRAKTIVDSWSFPEHRRVGIICDYIAGRCLARTLEANAPLGAGANAYGVPMSEFSQLSKQYSQLANVLKFGVAYNAFTLLQDYECKNKRWCLLELGGVLAVKHGLTFKRGGFVEGNIDELNSKLEEKS